MLHKLPRFLSYPLPRTTHKEPEAHNYLDTRGSVTKKWREFCGTGLLSDCFRRLLMTYSRTSVLVGLKLSNPQLVS